MIQVKNIGILFVTIAITWLTLLSPKSLQAVENTTYIYPPWKHTWGVRRATSFKLRLFLGNKTTFQDPQGIACTILKTWDDPDKTSDDDELTAYGVNSGANCIIYNSSMFSLAIYGLEDGHEKMNRPWGIAADPDGNVYVVDRGNSRVLHLFNPESALEYVKTIGGPGSEDGSFIDPNGVALDSNGNIYVTDSALGRVSVFNKNGDLIDVWDGFIDPGGIAVIGPKTRNFYRDARFAIVIDSLHQRIQKFSLNGELIASISAIDLPFQNEYFNYVAIDYHSQLIVTDRNNGCLYKFDRNLDFITRFGKSGRGDYEFIEPRGIAIHRHLGQILIAEREGAQYFWVAVDIDSFNASVRVDSIWKDLDIEFTLSEPAFGDIDVLDSYGRFITRISSNRYFPSGKTHMSWGMIISKSLPADLTNISVPEKYIKGERLPVGEYYLLGRFRAMYSSREYFTKEIETQFIVPY